MIAFQRPPQHSIPLRSPLRSGCCFAAPWRWLALATGLGLLAACAPVSAAVPPPTPVPLELAARLSASDSQPVDNQPGGAPSPTYTATPPASPQPSSLLAAGAAAYPTALPPRSPSVPVSDLLYLSQDRLLRWRPPALVPQLLAEDVQAISLTPDGRLAALLRPRRMTANGQPRFDLELLDLQTLQTASLLKESPPLLQIHLSSDGNWLAYQVDVEEGPIYALSISDLRQAIAAAPTPTPQQAASSGAPLTLQETLSGSPVEAAPRAPLRLGACRPQPACDSLDWAPAAPGALVGAPSPARAALIWSDPRGIWLANPGQPSGSPRLIQPAEISVADPKGQKSQVQVRFSQAAWSPQGRFILARVQPLNSPIAWYTLVDTVSGRQADIQDSYSQTPNQAQARWLPNGDLLVTHASDPARQVSPFVHLVLVRPTSPDLLVAGKSFDLYSDALPFSASARKIIPVHEVNWAGDPLAGRMPLGVNLVGMDAAPVLFLLDLQVGKLDKLADLPANIAAVYWSPDGSGGLMMVAAGGPSEAGSTGQRPLFITLDGSGFYDLGAVLGPDPHDFHWLPPARPSG